MGNGITKTSQALTSIACELLGNNVGDRVDAFLSIASRLGVSNGTVQNAFRTLESEGAVRISGRGHQGSFIDSIDYGKLLACAGISSVFCAMPIPYSKRYEGLASGIRFEISRLGLKRSGMMFISGSTSRVEALMENRADGIIMSSLALQHFVNEGYPLKALYKFPAGSYVNNHYLITRRGYDLKQARAVRVGIDEMSYDQAAWNKICFADKEVIPVPVHYLHVTERIKNGDIDAAVWSFEDAYFDDELSAVELHDGTLDENTAAVFVVRSQDVGMSRFLGRNINFPNIYKVQQAVLNGEVLPDY